MNRQLVLIVFTALMAISTGLMPYSQSLLHYYLSVFGYGLGSGVWFSAYNVWIIEMWPGHRSAPVLQLSQFMYGLGTIFGPMLDQPYTLDQLIDTENIVRRDKLRIPFLIIGCSEFIGPILLAIMYLIRPYVINNTYDDDNSRQLSHKNSSSSSSSSSTTTTPPPQAPVDTTNGSTKKSIVQYKSTRLGHSLLVGLLSNLIGLVFVSDNIYLKFSATYFQYIPMQLTASQSATLVTQMAVWYTMGRAITVAISIRLKPHVILSYHWLILLLGLAILSVGHDYYHWLWLGALVVSYGFSALLPAVFAYAGQYVELTNRLATVVIFNCGLYNSFLPYLLGLYVELYPGIYLLIILVNTVCGCMIFLTISLMTTTTTTTSTTTTTTNDGSNG
ncbi:uncharacterized protein LOC128954176 [Oppia nitens]|uniref:uncharacterized protein LOC128954176 n=1 Tax=Oppia nitens TaxID=1686743 RepID=UPI0023DCD684|nr:uncharacterized protein LOC128954176 [Oppia nitens]